MNSSFSHGLPVLLGIQILCAGALVSPPTWFDATPRAQGTTLAHGDESPEAATVADATSTSGVSSSHGAAPLPVPVVLRSSGAIEADLDLFRSLLGGSNNGATPGEQSSGRREINWDGVPSALTNVPTFPPDFFNTNSPRGLIYESPTPGLEVSDQSFSDVNPDYAGEFVPFSGHKVFSPIGTNEATLHFAVAGSTTKAGVRGIGIVFVDVDKTGTTAIELLGENGVKLGRFTAPVRSDRRGSSFLGIVFRNPVIREVHVVTGDAALSIGEVDVKHGGQHDLVVMDDFIYGEPTATRN